MNILSIDAWRDADSGWTWNNWFRIGSITRAELDALDTDRKILRYMRASGYLSAQSAGRVSVDDDGYNVVILARGTREPIFAIAYGEEL